MLTSQKILRVANNNETILSSTHCSAPSAWPFRGNIIGFPRFWRKLAIFCTRNIYQIERPFIKKYLRFWTIILWHLLHRLVWFFFYFLCFFWFNRVYLWYLVLFLLFYFSIKYSMVKWIYVGWFHTYAGFSLALERSWCTCLSAGVTTVCWK